MATHQFAKDLVTGTYDLIILRALRNGPAYGYEIRRRIFEQSKRTILWREGTLYHVFHHLEEQRLVTSSWRTPRTGRERRYYQLTGRGHRICQEQRAQWYAFTTAVNGLLGS